MGILNGVKINHEKKPYFIQLGEGELIYFAGVWRKRNIMMIKKEFFQFLQNQQTKK